ncbi:MAG: hypothetical protein AAFZ92_05170 [Pseudomonadota bacterium]
MKDSNTMVNPIIQGEASYTLTECSHCFTYFAESTAALSPDDISKDAFLGLRAFIECVSLAIHHENLRLQKAIDTE